MTYELIRLKDNEFPAESTTALYDEQRCILYLQRNVYGISIRNLEIYLKELSPSGTIMCLKPKLKGKQIEKIVPSNLYRRVFLVADTEQFNDEQKGSRLYNTLKNFNDYNGKIIKVDIGFGRKRDGFLQPNVTSELVHEAYNYVGTQKLNVSTSDPDDIEFETINLLDDRATYRIPFSYSRQNPITHERLYNACKAEYKQEHGIKHTG